MDEKCCIKEPPKISDHLRRYYYSFCLWLYLNIWCKHFYRHVMRFLHKFHIHYAPPVYVDPFFMEKTDQNNLYRQHWCQWCGLRGDALKLEKLLK